MTISTVRRLAADIMNIGQNKVRISPDGLKDAEGALTRTDVKGLIDKGIVTKAKTPGRASTRRKGRRGHGRRRGTPVAGKDVWMMKIRAQRKFLELIVKDGALKKDAKRLIYKKMKSGIFRNKRAMLVYLIENKLVAEGYEPKKAEFKKPEPKPKSQKSAGKPAKKESGTVMAKTELKPMAEQKHAGSEHKPSDAKNPGVEHKNAEHSKKGEQR